MHYGKLLTLKQVSIKDRRRVTALVCCTHHVSKMVHGHLEGLHAQRRLLVVGLDDAHVLLPDGPANLLLTLSTRATVSR